MDPLKYLFEKPALTERLARWLLLLSEFDITYDTQKSINGSPIAEHLSAHLVRDNLRNLEDVFFEEEVHMAEEEKKEDTRMMFFDGAANHRGCGAEEVINWGLSGQMLRASGIQWDLRKVDHYECYDEFDWEVQWQKEGDSLSRYLVRINEMKESIKIIQQALEGIPGGPYENLEVRRFDRTKDSEWNDFEYRFISKKPSPTFELSKQELYVRVEAPKGELGIFLIGAQSISPWRWKIHPPGFINLQILPQKRYIRCTR
ncbi:hypothetical protein NE237_019259 [Protea cynaroides]|uniref:NADH-quinone oxidoreductase subunit D domain-containing protein n=1 Tax=Protea cynaroides TaxID=273540 RepID=A0A9Q0QPT6_9MAGN|nr:hypothetical protein NE237_019259 [Protea cynaroides]